MHSDKQIEDYLLGHLPLNERITFESEIQDNPDLHKKVDQYNARLKELENLGRISILEDMDQWRLFPADKKPEKIQPETKKAFTIGRFVGYFLVIGIILLAGYISSQYDPVKNFSTTRTFSFYFEPINVNNIITYEEYSMLNQQTKEVIDSYANEEYDKALSQFQSNNDLNDNRAIYLIEGISHLRTGHVDSAIHKFRYVSSMNHEYKEHADWYLALAYIKKNELENSKNLLLDMTEKDGTYHAKAMELLKVLIPLTLSDAGQSTVNGR